MAKREHVAVARRGTNAVDQWVWKNRGTRLDLSGADLAQAQLASANLAGANLSRARLERADLIGACLVDADLSWAKLFRCDLTGAALDGSNLTGAHLAGANLTHANLTGADLTQANLFSVNLNGGHLNGAILSGVLLGPTSLTNVDLSQAVGLGQVHHLVPSSIGVDTLMRSLRSAGGIATPELWVFFRGAGVPQEVLDALPGIIAEVKYNSCFVSYGEPDSAFARKLCQDLGGRGVSCWLYEMDATAGERTWREIGKMRREAEKMVVLCSAKALVRDGVLKEIEEQTDEDPDKMVPVSLDDLWREPGFRVMRGSRNLKPFLLERNYADFANLPYDDALERLLTGLKRKTD